jgi:uncharacterized RDD family membrane protein YckC
MIDDPAETGTEPPRRRGLVGGVIGRVAPVVMRQIDMDAVVGQLDVNAIAAQLDLDALMARLDMDALVDRLDVNLVADKLDLDALMARLDMDALVDRLDVNLVAENLDLDALMTRIDMAQLTAGATQDVAVSGLDLLRRQLVRADATVDGVVGRVIRRTAGERPETPTGLADAAAVEIDTSDGDEAGDLRRRDVSGHYAGPVTRLLALAGDISAALGSYGFVGAVTLYFLSTFTGIDVTFGSGGWVSRVLVAAWVLAWFWIPVAAFGRTLAMAVVGVAVVRRDGKVANSRRALVRALVLPVSVAILLLGLLGMVIGRERRTLHDAAAGTVVVYDWGARDAEQPVSIREQLSARVRRREERLDA